MNNFKNITYVGGTFPPVNNLKEKHFHTVRIGETICLKCGEEIDDDKLCKECQFEKGHSLKCFKYKKKLTNS